MGYVIVLSPSAKSSAPNCKNERAKFDLQNITSVMLHDCWGLVQISQSSLMNMECMCKILHIGAMAKCKFGALDSAFWTRPF